MRRCLLPPSSSSPQGRGRGCAPPLPKVLHPLCGRPLIAWPIAAAREAGAGKVVVVDGPKRRLADHLPDGVVRGRPGRAARDGRRRRGRRGRDRRGRHGRGRDGRRPARRRRDADRARRGARGVGRRRDDADRRARGPDGLRARGPRRRGPGRARRRDQGAPATRARPSSRSARSTRASSPSTAARCSRRSSELEADNAQGELYLPDVLPRMREAGREIGAHVATDWTVTLGINDRVDLARVRAIAQERINEAHMRAGVTLDRPARPRPSTPAWRSARTR